MAALFDQHGGNRGSRKVVRRGLYVGDDKIEGQYGQRPVQMVIATT